MCLQCGCGRPYDDMGDKDNLVVKTIKESVKTKNGQGLTTDKAIENIIETWKKVKAEDKKYKASPQAEKAA